MRRVGATAAAGMALMLLAVRAGAVSDDRNRMSVPPSTIFKGMLRFAGAGELEKMQRSLDMLKPVLSEHESTFGRAAAGALLNKLRSSDAEIAIRAVRVLVARDSVILLRAVAGAPLDRARTLSRTSALEWRTVADESLSRTDPETAARIEASYKELFRMVEAHDAGPIRTLATRMEKDIFAAVNP